MKKIISVVGARPNFMKVAPVSRAFNKFSTEIQHLICHTGQHFDSKMSDIFFEELHMPAPTFNLGIGGGSHAEQTSRIIIEIEKILVKESPDLLLVYGDVNSTMASSLVASKLKIPIAHVESGLRSFDRSMPEEINRIITDSISDYLFVTEDTALVNLKNEGIPENKISFIGNVMIDTLVNSLPRIEKSLILPQFDLEKGNYILATFHRPSNVDEENSLIKLVDFLNAMAKKKKVVFPIHPRTKANLDKFGLITKLNNDILLIDPLGYIDFLSLIKNAILIITDSGGIQEESTYLGVQCITVRTNTERPVTVTLGTNQLLGVNLDYVQEKAIEVLDGKTKLGKIPPMWDGKAAERLVQIIYNSLVMLDKKLS